MDLPTINVVVVAHPDTDSDMYVVEGDFDSAGFDATVTETSTARVQVVNFDTYPATPYCTEPEEYADFPACVERLAALVALVNPDAAKQLEGLGPRFAELWPHVAATGHTP